MPNEHLLYQSILVHYRLIEISFKNHNFDDNDLMFCLNERMAQTHTHDDNLVVIICVFVWVYMCSPFENINFFLF